ncbi:hypothetical protein [Amycolatopsis regifaucium]|uniref:hypothetical protein n=1 Tax=Amycolatopsis regifaucium TaxID=546365 RepID=UPI000AC2614A|nr:hypothetical protein [Amycolatopsis regifaucium]
MPALSAARSIAAIGSAASSPGNRGGSGQVAVANLCANAGGRRLDSLWQRFRGGPAVLGAGRGPVR